VIRAVSFGGWAVEALMTDVPDFLGGMGAPEMGVVADGFCGVSMEILS
jgi:hypothetical protein